MKFAIVFLFLGIGSCLVSTNANAIRKKKMTEAEAMSNGRGLAFIMNRYSNYKNCARCSDIERYCMEKAIVEDFVLLIKLLAGDMGCSHRDLLGKLNIKVHFEYVYGAFERNDIDTFCKHVRANAQFDALVQGLSSILVEPLKQSNVELGGVLNSVNGALGGTLNIALGLVDSVIGGLLGGTLGAVGGVVGGAVDAISGVAGGLLGGATGVLGGLTDTAGGLVGGLTGGLTGGLLGGGGGKKGGLGSLLG
ncbi:uncharacterized protein LOC134600826 [Pelobates fuscus]|uniref:uncharacterized protein LOC134600826 n=1 Tax=Pelobates fuscus TaxID=191477 RepID=UPI002FE49B80